MNIPVHLTTTKYPVTLPRRFESHCMNLFRPFWTYLARRLDRHAGMIRSVDVDKLKGKIDALERFRFRTERRAKGLKKAESLPSRQFEGGDESVLREAWRLRNEEDFLGALNLLEAQLAGARAPEMVRVFQAWLAYEKSWDTDAIRFLREAVALVEPERDTLIWGPVAIISNSHWSRAMNAAGRKSQTIMWDYARINRKEDFDLYLIDLMPDWLIDREAEHPLEKAGALPCFLAFLHLVRHALAVHLPMTGSFLGYTRLWREEAPLLREASIKIVALPYGGDYYCYSRVQDPSVRHGLLANYPELAIRERDTQEKVDYWQREADCVLAGYMVDAMGRWDVATFNFFHIDTDQWQSRGPASGFDGRNGPVKVMHTPNHRGFKGTEFLIAAVEKLRARGLQVELVLLEKVPNEKVRQLMQEVDILAEQFIATAYAFSGIEGMASGLPVMANLDDPYYTRIYRRYSFLNECPIFSTTPETLERNLEILVTRPALRTELGRAGRAYVEKFHSFPAAQFLFGKIYERILEGKEVDLINLYHPLTSEFAKAHSPIDHPLVENRLPENSPHAL